MLKTLRVPAFLFIGAITLATFGCSSGGGGATGAAGKGGAGAGGAGTGGAGTGGAGTGTAGTGTAGTGATDAGTDSSTDASDAAPGKEVVYANAGTSLYVFDFNTTDGTLTVKPALTTVLAQVPQFAAIDSPLQKYMYVPATIEPANYVYSFSIDPAAGGLTRIAPPAVDGGAADGGATDAGAAQGVVSPNGRAIHASLSKDNKYLLAVHNVTKAYTVFNLGTDGTVGATVPQAGGADVNVGAFVHQIRVDPSGQYVIICDRGTDPTMTAGADGGTVAVAEGLGHLRTFGFANGVLTPIQTVTFPAGYGPRHVDFHPTKPWVYVSVGRGNLINTYSFQNGMLTQADSKTSLASATEAAKFPIYVQDSVNGQQASGIIVHPSGKWLWISNTNRQVVPYTPDAGAGDAGSDAGDGGSDAAPAPVAQVFNGTGVNNIALFSIDQTTGVPTFVAAADSHGFVPRTFALDPSGRYLLAGNQKKVDTLVGSTVTTVQPNVAVFSVAADGKLTFVKSYDLTTGDIFWVGGRTVTGP